MKTSIQLYTALEQIVQRLYTHLKLEKQENTKGRTQKEHEKADYRFPIPSL